VQGVRFTTKLAVGIRALAGLTMQPRVTSRLRKEINEQKTEKPWRGKQRAYLMVAPKN
jgi:hypothetical protein